MKTFAALAILVAALQDPPANKPQLSACTAEERHRTADGG
jgi:hypothetical protein